MDDDNETRCELVATIPNEAEVDCYDPRLVNLLRPDSWEAEQFRALRYAVERQLDRRRGSVVAVSSAVAGSGKTTTSINLAAALAEAGSHRVLLIDADLRQAAVARRLGLRNVATRGLPRLLADSSLHVDDGMHWLREYGFGVLPTAPSPVGAHRLIASTRMAQLLGEARMQYDCVIVDTPPLVPVADCRSLAPYVDGFVVVVAAHKTPRKSLEEALNAMSPESILGLVFNGDDGPVWGAREQYGAAY